MAAEAYKSDFNVPVLSAPYYTPVNQVSDSESEYFLVSQSLTKRVQSILPRWQFLHISILLYSLYQNGLWFMAEI